GRPRRRCRLGEAGVGLEPVALDEDGDTCQGTSTTTRLRDTNCYEPNWNSRGHFFAAAAEAMRRILVEAARRKRRVKHGGGQRRQEVADVPAPPPADDILALDEAL